MKETVLQNSTRIKLYTPKEAARAMLAGAVLTTDKGLTAFWNKYRSTFTCETKKGDTFFLTDFYGLYSEL